MDRDPSDLKIEFKLVDSKRVTRQERQERQTDRVSDRVHLRDPPDPKGPNKKIENN